MTSGSQPICRWQSHNPTIPQFRNPALPHFVPARQIIRQRRSAVDMDGVTSISREAFYRIAERLLPGQLPFTALPWKPSIHLAIFVHRVRDLTPGLYLLVRDPAERAALQAEMNPGFVWQQPESCPATLPLYLLQAGDHRQAAQSVSCGQEIASDGAFAVGMIAEYAAPLEQHGPWFYRRLHWEAGVIGQMLYLEAEAAGIRGTGIGCFFDELDAPDCWGCPATGRVRRMVQASVTKRYTISPPADPSRTPACALSRLMHTGSLVHR